MMNAQPTPTATIAENTTRRQTTGRILAYILSALFIVALLGVLAYTVIHPEHSTGYPELGAGKGLLKDILGQ